MPAAISHSALIHTTHALTAKTSKKHLHCGYVVAYPLDMVPTADALEPAWHVYASREDSGTAAADRDPTRWARYEGIITGLVATQAGVGVTSV